MTNQDFEEKVYWIENNEIKSNQYRYFLAENYSNETTTPRGVAPRLFVEFVKLNDMEEWGGGYYMEDLCDKYSVEEIQKEAVKCEKFTNEDDTNIIGAYTISTWGCCGNHRKTGKEYYSTKKAANEALYEIWEKNFFYHGFEELFKTNEEAEARLLELEAEEEGVSVEVLLSIKRRKKCIEKVYAQRRAKVKASEEEEKKARIREFASNLPKDDNAALHLFFNNEIHPAPQRIVQLKNKSGLTWSKIRKIYK